MYYNRRIFQIMRNFKVEYSLNFSYYFFSQKRRENLNPKNMILLYSRVPEFITYLQR